MANVHIFDSPELVAEEVAKCVQQRIESNKNMDKKTILCLPTGSTPIPVYEKLIKMHENENLSFQNVISFNLDEYFPMEKSHHQSYHYYMNETFFSKIKDFKPENINIPDGELNREDYEKYCFEFERKIEKCGGFDIALVGIGRTGHIGFNEPGSSRNDPTRLVVLHNQTRKDNSRFFENLKKVPKFAITQGIGTIMKKSKMIILIATGFHKSRIILKTLEGVFRSEKEMSLCPASFLRDHPNCHFYLDKSAAYRLKHVRQPWLTTNPVIFDWDQTNMKKKAVVWLSREVNKPILNLTEEDFCNNGLSSLFYLSTEGGGDDEDGTGRIQALCNKTFNNVLSCIHRERTNELLPNLEKERVLIFSPHPDDDVMSIGGTILSLFSSFRRRKSETTEERAKVSKTILSNFRICYMTSGSRGVSNDDIKDHLRFTKLSISELGIQKEKSSSHLDEILKNIVEKRKKEQIPEDSRIIQRLKTNVRKSESMNAIEKLLGCSSTLIEGLKEELEGSGEEESEEESCELQFLDLPFYQTGRNKKLPCSKEDVDHVVHVLEEFRPEHIFVCNDLEDVHGTHGICFHILKEALEVYNTKNEEGRKRKKVKKVFLYKGLWQEFDLSDVNVFVALDEHMMNNKIASIFKHQSQQNKPMFPGDDKREFFVRAKERNMETTALLTKLGLPAYFAMESLKVVEDLSDDD